jgi:alginate O-acetyltransferase complex protein AlgI
MVFSGITFLMYFLPFFFAVYFLLPDKLRNSWIVVCSVLFYAWGAPAFIFTVIASVFIDYLAIQNRHSRYAHWWMTGAILSNIGMLVYFKYANFFIANFNHLSEWLSGYEIPAAEVIMPIGISFITFQKISYLIDVKRGDCRAQDSFINHLLFVLLFPQLIAGPIVRYKEIGDQITSRFAPFNPEEVFSGLVRFIIGLAKKVLIANTLGQHADEAFSGDLTSALAWTGILAYTFQIYFDFAGYSDMAIGLGRMMGFRFPENFNFPYTSRSITEFWKRWHMTLGNWMKDYLYIPLGGNRGGQTYRNLMTVFLLSGLWHGASWNFVIWGAFHGSFLVTERLGFEKWLKLRHGFISAAYTFFVVMTGWVLFRAETWPDAVVYYSRLFSFDFTSSSVNWPETRVLVVMLVAMVFSWIPVNYQPRLIKLYQPSAGTVRRVVTSGLAMLVLYILCLGELMSEGFNPFIYFRF